MKQKMKRKNIGKAKLTVSQLEFNTQGFRIAIIFPVVSLILDYLALRAIFHDEMLVRSLDRIR